MQNEIDLAPKEKHNIWQKAPLLNKRLDALENCRRIGKRTVKVCEGSIYH